MTNTYLIEVNVDDLELKELKIVPRKHDNGQLSFKIVDIKENTTSNFIDSEEDLGEKTNTNIDISEPIIEQKTALDRKVISTPFTVKSETSQTSQPLTTESTIEVAPPSHKEHNACTVCHYALYFILFLFVFRVIYLVVKSRQSVYDEETW